MNSQKIDRARETRVRLVFKTIGQCTKKKGGEDTPERMAENPMVKEELLS